MSKIYVAGKNIKRAKSVMDMLRQHGHTITFDWLIDIRNETDATNIQKAYLEREGIREADILVYLWEPDQESARYEAGMAMGLGKKILIVGNHQSFFFKLPEVILVENDSDILSVIQ
jgi:hypothetical protein